MFQKNAINVYDMFFGEKKRKIIFYEKKKSLIPKKGEDQ